MPIAKIQLPDGRIGKFEVPEGTTPDQVLEFAGSMNGGQPSAGAAPMTSSPVGDTAPANQQPGVMDFITEPLSNFNDSMKERGARFADIVQNPGNFSDASRALQATGNVVGTATDAVGVPIAAGIKLGYDMLPDMAKNGLKKVAPLVEAYNRNESAYEKDSPEAAGNFKAVRELGGALPLTNPGIRKGVGSAIESAAETGGSAIKNVAKDTAAYVGEGKDTIKAGLSARRGDDLMDEAGNFKTEAGNIRTDVKNRGVVITPQSSQNLASTIEGKLGELEFIPELSPKTSIIVNKIKSASENGLTLNQLDQYRRLLRSARDEDTVAASAVRRAIDDSVNALQPADLAKGDIGAIDQLNAFRKQYTQASKFEDIAEIVNKSKDDPNKLKNNLARFLDNSENTRGWSNEEIANLENAANYSTIDKIMRGLGKFGVSSGNTYLPTVGAGFAYSAAGAPATAALVGAGTGARQLYKVVTRGKTEKLLREIEKGRAPVERTYKGEVLPPQGQVGAFSSGKKAPGNPTIEQLPPEWFDKK